ncbi:MAG: Kelch repeat-containing protein, partial [Candidatus Thorarchaeota archaeon]
MAKRDELRRVMFTTAMLCMLVLSTAPIMVVADQADLPLRGNPGMAYDSESDRIVIFGGWNNTGTTASKDDTWTYDFETDTYTKMDPSTKPVGRAEPGFAYDSSRDQILLFGGMMDINVDARLNDSWIYDYNTDTWTEVFPTTAPSPRRAHAVAYDSESDMYILFGGEDGTTRNDTWVGNPASNTWTLMSPSVAPPARMAHKMAYDSESDRIILFGGNVKGTNTFFFDTWAYDFNTNSWENLTTFPWPQPRGSPSLDYDSESDRIVLFGGSDGSGIWGDTWIFDYNTETWIEQSPSTSPEHRSRHGSAYDSQSDRVVIYGGTKVDF